MDRWSLMPADAGRAARQRGAAALIGAIGTPGFAAATLRELQQLVGARSWSVYRLRADRPPELHLSASLGVPDTTRDCFAVYRDALYRRDRSFDGVRAHARPGDAALLRLTADEVPDRDHRDAIYRRHGLSARLSVTRLDDDGALLALNLYRHGDGAFGDDAVAHLAELGPLLLAGVDRHLAEALRPAATVTPTAAAPTPRERLRQACPALTARELDVCERVLRGLTYDGIAADLGLSVPTVKTYRARAFSRLGLHFRHQLHARLAAAECGPTDA